MAWINRQMITGGDGPGAFPPGLPVFFTINGKGGKDARVPTREVERLVIWGQLRHRIIAFQLEADLPKLTDDSKQELTYIPVFLGGRGPSDSFWQEQRRVVALHDEGLRLDEFILQESARPTRGPTDEEREAQQERELPFLRKLIDLTYEAYRNDWVEQGKEISPAFLRAVRQKVFAAVTLYLMEDEKLTRELLNTSCLHLPVGFAPARLATLLKRLPMSPPLYPRFQATDYINNLVKRMRPEALKLESAAAPPRKEDLSDQPLRSPDDSPPVQLVAKSKEGQGRKRTRDPDIVKRDRLIVTLRDVTYASLTGINRNKKIADTLAEQQDIFPPRHWGIQSFKDAPRQKPQELHQMIYKAHV